jgi:hypothetical protein
VIPGAWITGTKPHERLAAWLNRVTGQAPPFNESFLSNLRINGFDLAWEMLDLGSSRVLLVKLLKLPNQADVINATEP